MQTVKITKRWDTIDGLRIFALTSESAPAGRPPVVLVHGLSVSSRYMRPLARQLAPDYPIYAPDLPGFGRSQKPKHILNIAALTDFLAAWLDAAGLERPVLVGNSMGCHIIVQLAARLPDRISRAVLIGPTIDPRAATTLRQLLRGAHNMIYEPISIVPILMRDYLSAGWKRTFRTLHYSMLDPIEDYLPHVTVPVLVLRGAHDTIVPQAWAEQVAQRLPNARLAVVLDGAHAANYDAAPLLANQVREFLEETNTPPLP